MPDRKPTRNYLSAELPRRSRYSSIGLACVASGIVCIVLIAAIPFLGRNFQYWPAYLISIGTLWLAGSIASAVALDPSFWLGIVGITLHVIAIIELPVAILFSLTFS